MLETAAINKMIENIKYLTKRIGNSMLPVFLFLLGLSTTSCLKEKTEPATCFEEVSYEYEIRPIIESSCKTQQGAGTGCHDAWIDDYSQIKPFCESGAWQNRVLVVKDMPVFPNSWAIDSLTSIELQKMQCWIDQGYPNN